MRVYLDVCCLKRPLDDLSIDRNRLEAEAVVAILHRVASGDWQLIGSEAVEIELDNDPNPVRRSAVADIVMAQAESIPVGQREYDRMQELRGLGFGRLDGLHIACAEAGHCSVLLTTDDQLLRLTTRSAEWLRVRVANPVTWFMEQTR